MAKRKMKRSTKPDEKKAKYIFIQLPVVSPQFLPQKESSHGSRVLAASLHEIG